MPLCFFFIVLVSSGFAKSEAFLPRWLHACSLFRKRPKLQGRVASSPALLGELGRLLTSPEDKSSRLPLPADGTEFLKAVDILDGPSSIPAVIQENTWENFCRLRRLKIDAEFKVKQSF